MKRFLSLVALGAALGAAPAAAQTTEPAEAPRDGQTTAPAAGQTMTPDAGQTTAPAAGQTTTPGAGQTTDPAAGQTTAPGAGQTTAPDAGQTTAPAAGQATTPDAATAPGAGQTAAPAAPRTAAPAQAQVGMPVSAEAFVPLAISSNGFEIESSRVALERSENPAVREFAQQMINDHSTATRQLQAAAADAGVSPVELRLDQRHHQMLEQVRAAEGTAFDQTYVELQRAAHEEAIAMHQAYAQGGDNEALRSFAAETLPILQQHAQMVEQLTAN